MARLDHQYVCQSCGAVHPKWAGRCDGCGAWNTLVEETQPKRAASGARQATRAARLELVELSGPSIPVARVPSGIDELDRVLGGGLVPASAILIGGDPGIGKSTLTLQACARLARGGSTVVYVTGEESIDQIRLRAVRLGLGDAPVRLAAATSVEDILAALKTAGPPALLVVDSIQTMAVDALEQGPGTVSQLRAASQALIGYAKRSGTTLILVGHVTKDGQIAGPKLIEHMVDAVLYFEGERGHQFRILRAVKNRFGAANEIGVFEMREEGLLPVANPSALLLADREDGVTGAAVFAGMEGTRPVLLEIQALVAPSTLGTPRRAVVGWDSARLAMLLAVLETRCGLVMGARDVYLNVAGGLRISEPAADLAVAAALISSLTERPAPASTVFFGEVGLGGEVRAVGHAEARIKEAAKLGFTRVIAPRSPRTERSVMAEGDIQRLAALLDLFEAGDAGTPHRSKR